MNITHPRMEKRFRRTALAGLVCLAGLIGLSDRVAAQEIQPGEFTPLPAGTNLAIGYYSYGHNTSFNAARGPTFKNSALEINFGTGRYVHFWELGGHPVGIQLVQTFGSLSGANVGGQPLGSAFGAQNLALSGFVFPYVNPASKTNTNITAFIYPPTGSYDRNSAINVGDNRLRGDIQLGLTQGFGEHVAMDISLDAMLYGDATNSYPAGRTVTQNPSYRAQVWANYRWNPAFSTSLGYTGIFGGITEVSGFRTGGKTEEQRIRANAALFLTPKIQTMLELNHDVHVVGGFKQDFGATVRVLYVF